LATIAETCAYARISRSTLWRWLSAGKVKAYKQSYKSVKVDLNTVDAHLNSLPEWTDANGRTAQSA
jgi:excisionase family DNA binding protein